MPFDPNSPFDPSDPAQWWRLQNLPHILVQPKPPPGTPSGNPGDDGPDDWFVPEADGFPNDWIRPDDNNAPAPSPAPAPPSPQPNPAAANSSLEHLDPYRAFWSQMPASRAGAMAWHPPIFLSPDLSTWLPPFPTFPNLFRQFPPAANVPANGLGPGGIPDGIGRALAEQARANDSDPLANGIFGIPKLAAASAWLDPMSLAASSFLFGALANLRPTAAPLGAPWNTAARSFAGEAANLPLASTDLRGSVSSPIEPSNQLQPISPSLARASWTSAATDARGVSNYLRINGLDDDKQIAPHLARDPSNDLIRDAIARNPAPSPPFPNTSPEPDPVRTAQADIEGSVGTLPSVLREAVTAGRITEEEAAILQQRTNAFGVARGEKIQAALRARQRASSPPTSGEAADRPQPSSTQGSSGTAAPIPNPVEEPGPAKPPAATEGSDPPGDVPTSGLRKFLEELFKKVGPGPYAPPNGGVPLAKPYGRPRAAEHAKNDVNGAKFGCHTCGTKDFGTKSGNPVLDHQPAQALNPSPGAPTQGYPHCVWCSGNQGWLVNQILQVLGFL